MHTSERTPIEPGVADALICLATAGLTLASMIVGLQGASDEPYFGYRRYDAVMQLSVGSALMALWAAGIVGIVTSIALRKLSAWWLLWLLWAGVALLFVSQSPLGYLYDLENYILVPGSAVKT